MLRSLRAAARSALFAIRAESPNSLGDSRDRAVVTVDHRRYYQITGVERNEIVRRHVGAKQAKKKVAIAGRGWWEKWEEVVQNRRQGGVVVRETSLKVSSDCRPSARLSRASSDNGDVPAREKKEEKRNNQGEGIRRGRGLIVH